MNQERIRLEPKLKWGASSRGHLVRIPVDQIKIRNFRNLCNTIGFRFHNPSLSGRLDLLWSHRLRLDCLTSLERLFHWFILVKSQNRWIQCNYCNIIGYISSMSESVIVKTTNRAIKPKFAKERFYCCFLNSFIESDACRCNHWDYLAGLNYDFSRWNL